MTAYDSFAGTADGRRRLARARLRHRVLEVLHESLERSKMSKADVSRSLGIRKSAVSQIFGGDGNLRVNTIADYLDAMGAELEVRVVPASASRVKCAGAAPSLSAIFGEATRMQPIADRGRVRPDSVRPWTGVPVPVES